MAATTAPPRYTGRHRTYVPRHRKPPQPRHPAKTSWAAGLATASLGTAALTGLWLLEKTDPYLRLLLMH